eukprot:14870_5
MVNGQINCRAFSARELGARRHVQLEQALNWVNPPTCIIVTTNPRFSISSSSWLEWPELNWERLARSCRTLCPAATTQSEFLATILAQGVMGYRDHKSRTHQISATTRLARAKHFLQSLENTRLTGCCCGHMGAMRRTRSLKSVNLIASHTSMLCKTGKRWSRLLRFWRWRPRISWHTATARTFPTPPPYAPATSFAFCLHLQMSETILVTSSARPTSSMASPISQSHLV